MKLLQQDEKLGRFTCSLRHCFFMLDVAHNQADVETEFSVVSLILIFL